MASLVPYPKAVSAYELGDDRYSGESVLEFIDTFRTDKNTFISNNDKLHKWAMWRSQVNGSFIRNLPVSTDLPIDETTVREKRINIDRFMVHSDTDELKRLQMKDVYGQANGYHSRLGHSTYFLYGIPRISTGKDIVEGKQDNRRKGPREFVDEVRSRTPTPPPSRKQHFFVGSSQGTNSVVSDDHGLSLELSHALKSTSVFAKTLPEPLLDDSNKQHVPYKSEAPIQHDLTHQFDERQYEIRHVMPRSLVPRYVAPQINIVRPVNLIQYQPPQYEIWRETNLTKDPQYELEYQEGCVEFEDDLSSISGYIYT